MKNPKTTKVFVTGISSALMQNIISFLPKETYEIVGVSRRNKPQNFVDQHWIKTDIRNTNNWIEYLADADLVIHAAACTHTHNIDEYFQVNTQSTFTLVDNAKKLGAKQFVMVGSRTAVPNSGGYGISKLQAEEYVARHFPNALILKPAEIFGGNKAEGIEKLIEDSLNKAIIPSPAQVPSAMYPISLSTATEIMTQAILQSKTGTYWVNGPKAYQFEDVVRLANQIANKNAKILIIPKWVMYLAKYLINGLGLKTSIYPDQIDRLYAIKEHGINENLEDELPNYIKLKAKMMVK